MKVNFSIKQIKVCCKKDKCEHKTADGMAIRAAGRPSGSNPSDRWVHDSFGPVKAPPRNIKIGFVYIGGLRL